MPTKKHANLSASGSSRWMNCPPSAMLERKYYETNPQKQSTAAAEGSLAHDIAELMLRHYNGEISAQVRNKEIAKLRKDSLFSEEMVSEFLPEYVDFVKNICEAKKESGEPFDLFVEQQVSFDKYVPGGFGTSDATIASDSELVVVDLKYGRGVEVDAVRNSQLMLYALGAAEAYTMMYGFDKVTMVIVQPRTYNISEYSVELEKLLKWGEEVVRPKALMADKGQGEKKAGSWCRWCAVKPICRTHTDKMMSLAKYEFADPDLLDDSEIPEILEFIPMISAWAKSVEEYAETQLMKGNQIKGYKLVSGKSNRYWDGSKEYAVKEKLEGIGYEEDDYMDQKLLSPSKLEKLVGKKKYKDHFETFVVKPKGKPTLALESDRRKEYSPEESAKKDFSD